MGTVADGIATVRLTLNDVAAQSGGPRYSDAVLLGYYRDGVTEAYGLRPDLRFGSYGTTTATLELNDTAPFDGRERIAVEMYVVARVEFQEDQHVSSGRAQAALALSKALNVGG